MTALIPPQPQRGATEYRVIFDRVGRHGGRDGSAPPAPIVRSFGGDTLADSIALHARQFLGSPSFEVVVDMEEMRGFIFAGLRTAGSFTIEARPLPQQQDRRAS